MSKGIFVKNQSNIIRGTQKQCQVCEKNFNVFIREHQCKRCLKAVCSQCGNFRKDVFSPGFTKRNNRVCKSCKQASEFISQYIKNNNLKFGQMSDIGTRWFKKITKKPQNFGSDTSKHKLFTRDVFNQLWDSYSFQMRQLIGLLTFQFEQDGIFEVVYNVYTTVISAAPQQEIQNVTYLIMFFLCFCTSDKTAILVLYLLELKKIIDLRKIVQTFLAVLPFKQELKKIEDYVNYRTSKYLDSFLINALPIECVISIIGKIMDKKCIDQLIMFYAAHIYQNRQILSVKGVQSNNIIGDTLMLRYCKIQEITSHYKYYKNKSISLLTSQIRLTKPTLSSKQFEFSGLKRKDTIKYNVKSDTNIQFSPQSPSLDQNDQKNKPQLKKREQMECDQNGENQDSFSITIVTTQRKSDGQGQKDSLFKQRNLLDTLQFSPKIYQQLDSPFKKMMSQEILSDEKLKILDFLKPVRKNTQYSQYSDPMQSRANRQCQRCQFYTQQIQKYKERVNEKKKNLNEAKEQWDQARLMIESQIENLEKQKSAYLAKIKEIEGENNKLAKQIIIWQSKYQEGQNTLKNTERDRQQYKKQLSMRMIQLQQIIEEKNKLQVDLSLKFNQLNETNKKNVQFQNQIASFRRKYMQNFKLCEILEQKTKSLEKKLEQNLNVNDDLRFKIQNLEKSFRLQIQQIRGQNENYQSKHQQILNQSKQQREFLKQKQIRLNEALQKIKTISVSLEDAEKKIVQKQNLANQASTLGFNLAKKIQIMENYQRDFDKKEKNFLVAIQQKKSMLQEEQNTIKKLKQIVQLQMREIDNLKNKRKTQKEQDRLKEMANQDQKQSEDNIGFQIQMKNLKIKELQNIIVSNKAIITQHQQENKKLNNKTIQLNIQIQEKRQKFILKQQEAKNKEKINKGLQLRIKQLVDIVDKKDVQIDQKSNQAKKMIFLINENKKIILQYQEKLAAKEIELNKKSSQLELISIQKQELLKDVITKKDKNNQIEFKVQQKLKERVEQNLFYQRKCKDLELLLRNSAEQNARLTQKINGTNKMLAQNLKSSIKNSQNLKSLRNLYDEIQQANIKFAQNQKTLNLKIGELAYSQNQIKLKLQKLTQQNTEILKRISQKQQSLKKLSLSNFSESSSNQFKNETLQIDKKIIELQKANQELKDSLQKSQKSNKDLLKKLNQISQIMMQMEQQKMQLAQQNFSLREIMRINRIQW